MPSSRFSTRAPCPSHAPRLESHALFLLLNESAMPSSCSSTRAPCPFQGPVAPDPGATACQLNPWLGGDRCSGRWKVWSKTVWPNTAARSRTSLSHPHQPNNQPTIKGTRAHALARAKTHTPRHSEGRGNATREAGRAGRPRAAAAPPSTGPGGSPAAPAAAPARRPAGNPAPARRSPLLPRLPLPRRGSGPARGRDCAEGGRQGALSRCLANIILDILNDRYSL